MAIEAERRPYVVVEQRGEVVERRYGMQTERASWNREHAPLCRWP